MYIPNEQIYKISLFIGIGLGVTSMFIFHLLIIKAKKISEATLKYQMSLKDEDLKKFLQYRNEVVK